MINTKRALKITSLWVTIVYLVCYVGVAIIPGIRSWFMRNALHMQINMDSNIMSFGTFLSGLIIWNILGLLAVWLFVALSKFVKK